MDVLIAGAGPAGAIAGLVLARAGARVTLFDRAHFPREKLCGDTINPGALAILRRLGLGGVTGGSLRVDGMIVSGERGVRVTAAYGESRHGVALQRRTLDVRLLEAAVAAGAQVEEGMLVRRPLLASDGRTVYGLELKSQGGSVERRRASVTIAADGAHSRVARAVGLAQTPVAPRRWAVGGIFRGVAGLTTFGEMHVRERCYIGVAPLPGCIANACIVTADRDLLRTRDLLLKILRVDPELGMRFVHAEMIDGPFVLGPLALNTTAAGLPGVLLAGDAAGFIDPMTGDGLRFAFRGAELAAAEALRVLSGGWRNAHNRLAAARAQEFRAKWRFNRTLRALAASPTAVRAAGTAATFSPDILRRVVRYAGDVSAA